jgi:hypothetical protein
MIFILHISIYSIVPTYLRVAISANISSSIFSRFLFVTMAYPINSHMNVYKPKERLLTTQRKDGHNRIYGSKELFLTTISIYLKPFD